MAYSHTLTVPSETCTYQYRVATHGMLEQRRLPPPGLGGMRWVDDPVDDPWWEPLMDLPTDCAQIELLRNSASPLKGADRAAYKRHAELTFPQDDGVVVALAPCGTPVHYRGGCYILQSGQGYVTGESIRAIRRDYYRTNRLAPQWVAA